MVSYGPTYGTPLYRCQWDHQIIAWIVSLLANGCPPRAIVVTFGAVPTRLWLGAAVNLHRDKVSLSQRPQSTQSNTTNLCALCDEFLQWTHFSIPG